jgi:NAD(P) transhydrogenase subunit alpha
MKVGVPREIHPGERRVAATPDTVKKLQQLGFEVLLESGAGLGSNLTDAAFEAAGARIVPDAAILWGESDVVIKVRPPESIPDGDRHEADLIREGATLISFIWPAQNKALIDRIAARRATVLAMDTIPRISRAQKMDALSSMANISGYRAVIEAANAFGRSFMGQITAAGKLPPARVLVIGAGVAGLAAIGVARGLGAIVRAFDTRPAVREQVQSLGAEFLEVDLHEDGTGEGGYARVMSEEFIKAEMALFAAQAREVDVIITTAQIPGQRAPILITAEMVESMKEGSVIVDMAAEQGGNCALTRRDEVVVHRGVTIIGVTDMPSRLPTTSSQLYGTNVVHLLQELGGAKDFKIDEENEVVRGALILRDGDMKWPPPKPKAAPPAVVKAAPAAVKPAGKDKEEAKSSDARVFSVLLPGAVALALIGAFAPPAFLAHFTVFVLACFVGWQLIWNVTPALHTPLMSVTNAISGIIVIGGMLQLSHDADAVQLVLGGVSVLIATINIVGGFLVTQRMLMMFRK